MTPHYSLLGHPITHSLSPLLHNNWLDVEGLPGTYTAQDIPPGTSGQEVIRLVKRLGLSGVNLTVPLKTSVLPWLDAIDPLALKVGAVNTLVWREEGLTGLNTDVRGFLMELEDIGGTPKAKTLVLGAGGAARAVCFGLLEDGCTVLTILNRSAESALILKEDLQTHYPRATIHTGSLADLHLAAHRTELVVCCLSGGAAAQLRSIDVSPLPESSTWIDLNYWMDTPPHLQALSARGLRTGDGLRMLVHQGALAFYAFTGLFPDPEIGRMILTSQRQLHRKSSETES